MRRTPARLAGGGAGVGADLPMRIAAGVVSHCYFVPRKHFGRVANCWQPVWTRRRSPMQWRRWMRTEMGCRTRA